MSEKNLDRVNPMRWTDPDTSETYTWDFNRDSIRFAEQRGFKLEDFFDYMNTKSEEFFYYACRMYHKGLSRTQTDALFAYKCRNIAVNAVYYAGGEKNEKDVCNAYG